MTKLISFHSKADIRSTDIILLESLLCPRRFTEAVSEVLFDCFEVSRVFFFLRNTLPIYTQGIDTGLVIDSGELQTEVSPIVKSAFSMKGVKGCHLAGMAMEKMIKEMVTEDNSWSKEEAEERLTPSLIEDIKVKTCKVLTKAQSEKFLTEEGLDKMSSAK